MGLNIFKSILSAGHANYLLLTKILERQDKIMGTLDTEVESVKALTAGFQAMASTLSTIDAEVKTLVANAQNVGGVKLVTTGIDSALSDAKTAMANAQSTLDGLSKDAAPVATSDANSATVNNAAVNPSVLK